MATTALSLAQRLNRPVAEVREAIAELVRHWGRRPVHGDRPTSTALTPAAVFALHRHFGQMPRRAA